jgi:hypothetical protein
MEYRVKTRNKVHSNWMTRKYPSTKQATVVDLVNIPIIRVYSAFATLGLNTLPWFKSLKVRAIGTVIQGQYQFIGSTQSWS